MTDDREERRATFDAVAERYDRARPAYPDALFDVLMRRTGLAPGDRVLEIGCATGKATRPLAERGLRLTCVELGPQLTAVAQRNLAAYPDCEVVNAAFETWPPPGQAFDGIVAATAWHWTDPDVRYQRAWELLRPGGHLAFWAGVHVFPPGGDPFFSEIQAVYDEIGEPLGRRGWPQPRELPDERGEILATGLFDAATVTQFDWEVSYDAERYIDLLETFSGHISMQQWQRERLHAEIRRRLAERPDGRVRRHWGAALHIARRAGGA